MSNKPDRAERDQMAMNAMLGLLPKGRKFPKSLPITFARIRLDDGRCDLISIEDNVCTYRHTEYLLEQVAKWNQTLLGKFADYRVTTSSLQAITKAVFFNLPEIPLTEIKPFAFANDMSLAFHRCDFDPEPGDTPTFDEFLSRTSDPNVVKAFVGSIFVNESYLEQYLFMRGHGGDGKGSLIDSLATAFGERSFRSVTTAPSGDSTRFFAKGCQGKRFVAFPDLSDLGFLESDVMKAITGGDRIDLEGKGKDAKTGTLHCKVLVGSNSRAAFKYSLATKRRILPIDVAKADVTTGQRNDDYKQAMIAEAPYIIHKCLTFYNEHYPNHNEIVLTPEKDENGDDVEANSAVWDHTESFIDEILEKHFRVDTVCQDGSILPRARVPVFLFHDILADNYAQNMRFLNLQVTDIYRFLDQKFGVFRKVARVDSKTYQNPPGAELTRDTSKPFQCLMGIELQDVDEKTEANKGVADVIQIRNKHRARCGHEALKGEF